MCAICPWVCGHVCVFNNNHLHGNDNNLFTGKRGKSVREAHEERGGGGRLLQYSTDGKQAKTPTSCAVRINHASRRRRRTPVRNRLRIHSSRSSPAPLSQPPPPDPVHGVGGPLQSAGRRRRSFPGGTPLWWLSPFAPFREINYQRHIRARGSSREKLKGCKSTGEFTVVCACVRARASNIYICVYTREHTYVYHHDHVSVSAGARRAQTRVRFLGGTFPRTYDITYIHA